MMKTGNRSKQASHRVVRGGSWNNNGRNCRSAIRNRNTPDNRNNNLGFRLSPAPHVIGINMTDQIVIRFRRFFLKPVSKKQGRQRVSRMSGFRSEARWLTALFLEGEMV